MDIRTLLRTHQHSAQQNGKTSQDESEADVTRSRLGTPDVRVHRPPTAGELSSRPTSAAGGRVERSTARLETPFGLQLEKVPRQSQMTGHSDILFESPPMQRRERTKKHSKHSDHGKSLSFSTSFDRSISAMETPDAVAPSASLASMDSPSRPSAPKEAGQGRPKRKSKGHSSNTEGEKRSSLGRSSSLSTFVVEKMPPSPAGARRMSGTSGAMRLPPPTSWEGFRGDPYLEPDTSQRQVPAMDFDLAGGKRSAALDNFLKGSDSQLYKTFAAEGAFAPAWAAEYSDKAFRQKKSGKSRSSLLS